MIYSTTLQQTDIIPKLSKDVVSCRGFRLISVATEAEINLAMCGNYLRLRSTRAEGDHTPVTLL